MTDISANAVLTAVKRRHPNMPEFQQAVCDWIEDIIPYINANGEQSEQRVLEYLTEPDRVISFRVTWQDDQNRMRNNRGYRVQYSNALGAYKGGLRFHPNVNLSILHFLGFEQTFKNCLTGLPMGGAKGGADFDPNGKSEAEIRRFCQAFMTQLARFIGPDIDIPAGDIGVDTREIAYLFDQYKAITGEFCGVLTGKGPKFGGSFFRKEATGYGCVYFAQQLLAQRGEELEGKTCALSGAGNVALHTAEKLIASGAKVLSLSEQDGFVHFENGLQQEQLELLKQCKSRRGRLKTLAQEENWYFHPNRKPWSVPTELAFPCATQNELQQRDAEKLVNNECLAVFEAANMPCTAQAARAIRESDTVLAPSKAVNAGGVAVSGLEISQNRMQQQWTADKVDAELQKIMHGIHEKCIEYGQVGNKVDYKKGANIAAFVDLCHVIDHYGVT